MNYYIEITLLPDVEISLGFIWQKLFQQVHIALAENKVDENQSNIAVGFPEYGAKAFPLGCKLRLFALEQPALEKLNIAGYLARLSDYVHLKSIQPVPTKTTPVCFIRHHVKGEARIEKDMHSKALRWSIQTGQSLDECLAQLEISKPSAESDLPFIWLESQQTKQRVGNNSSKFPLFIKRLEMQVPQIGSFSCYGLSQKYSDLTQIATVPHFY